MTSPNTPYRHSELKLSTAKTHYLNMAIGEHQMESILTTDINRREPYYITVQACSKEKNLNLKRYRKWKTGKINSFGGTEE